MERQFVEEKGTLKRNLKRCFSTDGQAPWSWYPLVESVNQQIPGTSLLRNDTLAVCWRSDGLEWSSYRLTSTVYIKQSIGGQWITRGKATSRKNFFCTPLNRLAITTSFIMIHIQGRVSLMCNTKISGEADNSISQLLCEKPRSFKCLTT